MNVRVYLFFWTRAGGAAFYTRTRVLIKMRPVIVIAAIVSDASKLPDRSPNEYKTTKTTGPFW